MCFIFSIIGILYIEAESVEEAVGLRIYSLRPDENNPWVAVIVCEDRRFTGIIKTIIRKEGAESITGPEVDGDRFVSYSYNEVPSMGYLQVCVLIKTNSLSFTLSIAPLFKYTTAVPTDFDKNFNVS